MFQAHPLDQLMKDDSLFFLEAMIPFVDYTYKKPLILLIKYQEMRTLMQRFDNPDYIKTCGFDCHPKNSEEMMECLCRFLPGDYADSIRSMQQMMKMMQVMQVMNEPAPGDCPFSQPDRQGAFHPDPPDPPDPRSSAIPGCGAPPPPPDYEPHPKNLYDSVMDILNS